MRCRGKAAVLSFLWAILTLSIGGAELGAFELDSIAWRRLGPGQGFSGGAVAALLQDRRGYVWIGASGGLYRFDGVNFIRVGPSEGYFASVTCLVEDSQGSIWAGSRGMGLGVYHPGEDRFLRVALDRPEGGNRASVRSLAMGKDGRMIVAWADGGISALEKASEGQGEAFEMLREMPLVSWVEGGLGPVLADMSGGLWAGKENEGLRAFGGEGEPLGEYRNKAGDPRSLGSDSVASLFEDSLGYLWIGFGDGGVDLYQDGSFAHGVLGSNRYARGGAVISMAEDIKGRIWLGKEGGGIAVLEPSTMEISEENDFSGILISAMMRDRRGLMWLGLKQGGLATGDHRSSAVRRYAATADGDSLEGLLGMAANPDGRPRVLTRSGRLFEFDPVIQAFHSTPSLRATEAKDLWLGIGAGELARLPAVFKGRFRGISSPGDNTKESVAVLSVLDDGKGPIWIGTDGKGLVRHDLRGNRPIREPGIAAEGLAAREISALAKDQAGRIWAGSRDAGLFALDPGASAFRSVGIETRHGSGLGSSRIETIFEDSRGRLWIGTGGAGICSIDPVTGMVGLRGRDVGIPDDSVYGIAEDRSGRLWILASTGLYCFDTERKDIFLMGEEDGLPGAGFDSGAILAAGNGDIWISGDKGIAAFNPDRITRYAPPPDVLISDLVPFGDKGILARSRDGTEIVLPHDNAGLGFSIAVMDFSSASRNRYALMLEGRQTAWTETGNVNKGYLAPLAPGKYMLRVKAANGNGIWNNYGASLSIAVKPPWWGTWWFEILAFGGIALCAATIIALGARSLRKRNALLVKFARHIEEAREEERKIAARDVHDEIGQYLMALNFNAYWLSAHLDAGEEEKMEKIAEMRQTILGAMDSVKKIAQRLRPLSLEGNDFPDAIRVYIKNFGKMSGIESDVSIGEGWRQMPSEFARIFFRILQEMVSNVARHSGSKSMKVEFLSDEQWYILSVQDDGKGMDESEIEAHDSFGLIGMREACASEGGELELRTGKEGGCAVSAKLPRMSKGNQKNA